MGGRYRTLHCNSAPGSFRLSAFAENRHMDQPVDDTPKPADPADPAAAAPAADRRTFLKKVGALVAGGIAVMVPLGAGLATFFSPLRKRNAAGGAAEFIKVTTLEALKDDGLPHRFAVVADKSNVWMTEKNVAVGSVYLKRKGEQITAWNTVCPHLGCQVDVVADGSFKCPCHNSMFKPDGTVTAGSVSPRGMDELEVDAAALKDGEVRVKYQNFVASIAEKKPLS
jgi:menaquinol-cytochrome c reductase iron-sulfur subunit